MGKYPWEVAIWEITLGKIPNTYVSVGRMRRMRKMRIVRSMKRTKRVGTGRLGDWAGRVRVVSA